MTTKDPSSSKMTIEELNQNYPARKTLKFWPCLGLALFGLVLLITVFVIAANPNGQLQGNLLLIILAFVGASLFSPMIVFALLGSMSAASYKAEFGVKLSKDLVFRNNLPEGFSDTSRLNPRKTVASWAFVGLICGVFMAVLVSGEKIPDFLWGAIALIVLVCFLLALASKTQD